MRTVYTDFQYYKLNTSQSEIIDKVLNTPAVAIQRRYKMEMQKIYQKCRSIFRTCPCVHKPLFYIKGLFMKKIFNCNLFAHYFHENPRLLRDMINKGEK